MIGRISIDGLRVESIIGCLPQERTTPQHLRLDLWVDVETGPAADSDNLTDALDYTAVARQVCFILQHGRFYLLESAARMLLRHLLLPPGPGQRHPAALAAGVTLTKAGVFPHGACPKLTLSAAANELTWAHTEQPWGSIDTIDTSRRVLLERLSLAPGQHAPEGDCLLISGTLDDAQHATQPCSLLRVSPAPARDQ